MRFTVEYLEPGDVPRLHDLCDAQNGRDGSNYAPPEIFRWKDGRWQPNPNVPLALKLVRNGEMAAGYTFERRLEFSSFGIDPRATAAALRELPQALVVLKTMGYAGFHAAVPISFVDQWERSLGKRLRVKRDDGRLAHFYSRFRETE